jgi:hypothetical protein
MPGLLLDDQKSLEEAIGWSVPSTCTRSTAEELEHEDIIWYFKRNVQMQILKLLCGNTGRVCPRI